MLVCVCVGRERQVVNGKEGGKGYSGFLGMRYVGEKGKAEE